QAARRTKRWWFSTPPAWRCRTWRRRWWSTSALWAPAAARRASLGDDGRPPIVGRTEDLHAMTELATAIDRDQAVGYLMRFLAVEGTTGHEGAIGEQIAAARPH